MAALDVSRLRDLAISDAGFVFDPLTGHTYNVNETALAVLNALKAGASLDAVVAGMRDTFDVDPDTDLARDLDDLLAHLREQGLVR
jgi:PqqD family protein of HPr-rel-A system